MNYWGWATRTRPMVKAANSWKTGLMAGNNHVMWSLLDEIQHFLAICTSCKKECFAFWILKRKSENVKKWQEYHYIVHIYAVALNGVNCFCLANILPIAIARIEIHRMGNFRERQLLSWIWVWLSDGFLVQNLLNLFIYNFPICLLFGKKRINTNSLRSMLISSASVLDSMTCKRKVLLLFT